MDEATSKVRLSTYVPSPKMKELSIKIDELDKQKEDAIALEEFEKGIKT